MNHTIQEQRLSDADQPACRKGNSPSGGSHHYQYADQFDLQHRRYVFREPAGNQRFRRCGNYFLRNGHYPGHCLYDWHGKRQLYGPLLWRRGTKKGEKIASTGFFTGLIVVTAIMVIGLSNIEQIVMMLGSTETIKPYAVLAIARYVLAAPFMMCSFIMNNL